jgi:hypothetical protein
MFKAETKQEFLSNMKKIGDERGHHLKEETLEKAVDIHFIAQDFFSILETRNVGIAEIIAVLTVIVSKFYHEIRTDEELSLMFKEKLTEAIKNGFDFVDVQFEEFLEKHKSENK